MAQVLGIGGVFIKSKNPDALRAWYREMLGVDAQSWGAILPGEAGTFTVWNPFAQDTKYFDPSTREIMVNLRVDDADGLVAALKAKGVAVLDDRRQQSDDGVFCYVVDPDGTLLELWQPAAT